MYKIALDVGGTKIAGAIIKNNKIIKKVTVMTQAKKGKNTVIKKICDVIQQLIEESGKKNIQGIALGMPGLIDSKRGMIIWLPNLKEWKNIPIKKIIEKKFRLRTVIENDSNCAALGESIFFHKKNLVCLTIGTGLGSGIILNGKIYHGKGLAAEIGHMVINFNGPRCNCGNHGCLEEFVSVRGIKRIGKKYGLTIEPRELQIRARQRNKNAKAIYQEAGKYLGIGLSNIVNIFNPDMIVISGGISNAGNLILKPAMKEMQKRAFKYSQKDVKIVISKFKEDAGLLGASYLIK